MGYCKSCKFFRSLPERFQEERDAGWGTCVLADSEDGDHNGDSLAWAEGQSSEDSWLNVHETFGCVQQKSEKLLDEAK